MSVAQYAIYQGKNGQWYVTVRGSLRGPFRYWQDAFNFAVRKGVI